MYLSIIIPTINEAENIKKLILELKKILEETLNKDYEIIVVDDFSSDNTREVASSCGAKVLIQKKTGFGNALKEGFATAEGEYIITMDADFSHSPLFIKEMLKRVNEADMIVASRYIRGGSCEMGFGRYILSRILNKIYTKVLSLPFKDISSGFRLYKKGIISKLVLEAESFDILEELLIKIYYLGYRILEIPFCYQRRRRGISHIKIFKFGISYLITLFKMWKLRNSLFSADYKI